jgi:hypothetical protein
MSLSTTIKSHNYSIITALIIGQLTAVYLFIIVPNNEAKEDTNNLAIFKGIEGQLQGYIDFKLRIGAKHLGYIDTHFDSKIP